jgi:hypothetical protein
MSCTAAARQEWPGARGARRCYGVKGVWGGSRGMGRGVGAARGCEGMRERRWAYSGTDHTALVGHQEGAWQRAAHTTPQRHARLLRSRACRELPDGRANMPDGGDKCEAGMGGNACAEVARQVLDLAEEGVDRLVPWPRVQAHCKHLPQAKGSTRLSAAEVLPLHHKYTNSCMMTWPYERRRVCRARCCCAGGAACGRAVHELYLVQGQVGVGLSQRVDPIGASPGDEGVGTRHKVLWTHARIVRVARAWRATLGWARDAGNVPARPVCARVVCAGVGTWVGSGGTLLSRSGAAAATHAHSLFNEYDLPFQSLQWSSRSNSIAMVRIGRASSASSCPCTKTSRVPYVSCVHAPHSLPPRSDHASRESSPSCCVWKVALTSSRRWRGRVPSGATHSPAGIALCSR